VYIAPAGSDSLVVKSPNVWELNPGMYTLMDGGCHAHCALNPREKHMSHVLVTSC